MASLVKIIQIIPVKNVHNIKNVIGKNSITYNNIYECSLLIRIVKKGGIFKNLFTLKGLLALGIVFLK